MFGTCRNAQTTRVAGPGIGHERLPSTVRPDPQPREQRQGAALVGRELAHLEHRVRAHLDAVGLRLTAVVVDDGHGAPRLLVASLDWLYGLHGLTLPIIESQEGSQRGEPVGCARPVLGDLVRAGHADESPEDDGGEDGIVGEPDHG